MLFRSYGPRTVIDRLNLRIDRGEFVALLGESGCGKTTLLRSLCGLDAIDGGTIDGPRLPAVVFQEPRLLPWETLWRNVSLGLPDDGAKTRAASALGEVGLADRLDDWPRNLSGGQAQRVALARALAGRPRVLLLDEPFSAVDAFTRMKLQDLLVGLVRRKGIAAVMVTHDIDEAAWLADRVLVLDADPGRVREEIRVSSAQARERDDPALAGARARVFHSLRAAHAL